MSAWVVVVAGGSGSRFGGAKQFAALGDVRVVDHSIRVARTCGRVVLVVPTSGRSVGPHAGSGVGPRADMVVEGGPTRAASVRAGLEQVPADADVIVVHDAARPLAHASMFRAVVDAVREGAAGAVPGLPVSDTLKRIEGWRVVETVDRTGLVAVQTPHAVADAVLGAAGLGDLGSLFPAGDEATRGASSIGLLGEVARRVAAAGWWVVNVDVAVAAEEPRLAPHLADMVGNLTRALHPTAEPLGTGVHVSVKPKRAEGLGAIGRAEGVAAWAVALLQAG